MYSTRTLKSLGTLSYHAESCYALSFAHPHASVSSAPETELEEDNDEFDEADQVKRSKWLISAGKEGRIAFWELDSFESGSKGKSASVQQ